MWMLLTSACIAIVDWIAVARQNRTLEIVAKPATLLALCVWFGSYPAARSSTVGVLFLLGLVFSLLGDIFLLFPEVHFLKGLIAFLLAHLLYIAAFNSTGPILTLPAILLAVPIVIAALLILRRLIASLKEHGNEAMIVPVSVYALVLSLTLWSASTTLFRNDWSLRAGTLAAAGGVLFFVSDASIAWNRFVGPHWGGRLFEIVTYHLAQIGLAAGILISIGALG
ncbi:MAG: lysoplasmalogenase [Anaerolineales bacterium]